MTYQVAQKTVKFVRRHKLSKTLAKNWQIWYSVLVTCKFVTYVCKVGSATKRGKVWPSDIPD